MNNFKNKTYSLGPVKITGKNLLRLIITDMLVLIMILIPTVIAIV